MTSTQSQVPVKSNRNDLKALLQSDKVRNEIAAVAPKYMDPERMLRVALMVCMSNPKLLGCSQASLLSALLKCSAVGLEPDGFHAYLIPFGDTVQVIFGFQGLIFIAEQFGVTNVDAESICENDTFTWKRVGSQITICHEINWKADRGPVVSYYAVCERDGKTQLAVMTIAEIEAVRKTSKAANNGPWVTAYGEMCKKTVIRRLAKRWPRQGEIQKAFNSDDDIVPDRMEPKAPVFNQPMRSPTMDFLETPAGALTGAPIAEDNEKELGEAGLAPEVESVSAKQHMAAIAEFQTWLDSHKILYGQLRQIAVDQDLYEGADQYPSLVSLPPAAIKRLMASKEGILAEAKAVRP